MSQKEETKNITDSFFDGQDITDLDPDAKDSKSAPPVEEKDLESLEPQFHTEWKEKIR